MPPKIANLKRIESPKTRITTYKKRKACLYKKAEEFSTLCGVETCLIVYGPTKATDEVISEPEVWPRDETKVREIIRKYKETVSNTCRKENHIETFVNDTGKEKETENNNKRVKKKCSLEEKLDKCTQDELHGILLSVEAKLKEAVMRQNHIMNRVQHQAMETQNLHGLMDQYFMPQYLPEQQPQLMWPNAGYSFIRSHEEQMQMEQNLMENWTGIGLSQTMMMPRGNDGQMMQRPGPYHNVEPVVQMPPAFAFNSGYPGGYWRLQPPQVNDWGQLLEKKQI